VALSLGTLRFSVHHMPQVPFISPYCFITTLSTASSYRSLAIHIAENGGLPVCYNEPASCIVV